MAEILAALIVQRIKIFQMSRYFLLRLYTRYDKRSIETESLDFLNSVFST